MDRNVCVLLVPYMAGDERHGACRGPEWLVSAGIAERFADPGRVRIERVEREGPFGDPGSATVATYNPVLDTDDRTLRVVLRIAELLAAVEFSHGRRP